MTGVVKDVVPVPPARTEPPDAAAYQSMVVPPELVTDIVTVPVPHRCPFTALVGAAGTGFIVAVTDVLVAEIQPVDIFLVWA